MQDADQATNTLRQAKLVEAFLAAARNGEFEQLLAVLDPDVALTADRTAVTLGAPSEAHGAVAVARFCRRARGAVPALLNGEAAVAWAPGGQPRVVFKFTAAGAKITAIDLIADPARLHQLDLIAPLEEPAYPRPTLAESNAASPSSRRYERMRRRAPLRDPLAIDGLIVPRSGVRAGRLCRRTPSE